MWRHPGLCAAVPIWMHWLLEGGGAGKQGQKILGWIMEECRDRKPWIPTLSLPLPFQWREHLPAHRLPLATVVLGYLESHLQAFPYWIQCAAIRTAATWIPSSCPVRDREKQLVVVQKREEKKKRKKKMKKGQKSLFLAHYDVQIWEWGLWKLFV